MMRLKRLHSTLLGVRFVSKDFVAQSSRMRNIGIAAHIDSGKTTLSERILFYTGKIQKIHEVKGGTEAGATMDSMELEKERGITIRSAATFCRWNDYSINLIDTPGHVDFTIEVERALRVLDGGIMLMCAVAGVQSQTVSVDRQMRRYGVPRICFINKMDRDNADPKRALAAAIHRLGINAAFIQLHIGTAQDFEGVVDLVEMRAIYFKGKYGDEMVVEPIPSFMVDEAAALRKELIARLAEHDPKLEEHFINGTDPSIEEIHASIRAMTMANKFVPVMMGTAYKNKGVQLLLDAICKYLPNPLERENFASLVVTSTNDQGEVVTSRGESRLLLADDEAPLVAMIFKLEETSRVGFANYVRVYQGRLKKESLVNVSSGKTFTPNKVVRMHADSYISVDEVRAGDICAIIGDFGASSGDTIMRVSSAKRDVLTCEDMYVPPRVLSVSIKSNDERDMGRMQERLRAFMREDPTLYLQKHPETGELLLEGMGELHIDIYVERLKREYGILCTTGAPTVSYRETIQKSTDFDFIYKRQSGGAGQWAHVKGKIQILDIDYSRESGVKASVTLKCSNGEIREALQKSFMKHFERKIFPAGLLIGAPVWGVHVALLGGAMHEVDSNDVAFRNCAQDLWERTLPTLGPTLLEPWMSTEIVAPLPTMTDISSEIARREGIVQDTEIGRYDVIIRGEVALSTMFGFISDLRKMTKGQGTFSMTFKEYRTLPLHKAQSVIDARCKTLGRKPMQLQGG